jgi:hypothetical protein
MVRVSCIGDSITYGFGLPVTSRETLAYPGLVVVVVVVDVVVVVVVSFCCCLCFAIVLRLFPLAFIVVFAVVLRLSRDYLIFVSSLSLLCLVCDSLVVVVGVLDTILSSEFEVFNFGNNGKTMTKVSSYLTLPCRVSSRLVLSCFVLSCLVVFRLGSPCFVSLVLPRLVVSCLFCLVSICRVLSCLVLRCRFSSCRFLPCLVLSHLVLSCVARQRPILEHGRIPKSAHVRSRHCYCDAGNF